MNRVEQYARDVLDSKIIAGNTVKLACIRFFNDLENSKDPDYPYYFDEDKANEIIEFAEILKIGEGTSVKPLKLYPWQCFILGCLNGWRHKSNPDNKRFRHSYTQVSRQAGKSLMNGILAAYYGNFTSFQYPTIFLAANSQMQSRIVYKEIVKFINSDSELSELFKVKDYRSTIDCLNTNGQIRALSQETRSLDGFRCYLGVLDELHQHKDNQLYKLLSDGQVKLEDCLISAITTSGFDSNSFCYHHYLYCKSVLNGTHIDEKQFVFISELDENDDIWDEKNWYKVHPCLQYDAVLLENIRSSASQAYVKGGEDLRNFQVKVMNIWLNGIDDKKYLQPDNILKCKSDKDISFLRNKNVVVGLDLSSGGDLTSIALEHKYNYNEQNKYFIHQHSFMPSLRLEEHEKTDKAPYSVWVQQGLITTTPGWKTDYKFIIKYLKDLIKEYNLKIDAIYYDPHNASTFLSDLEEITDNLIEVRQSAKNLNDATVDFSLEVKSGNVEFNKDDGLLIWSLSNAIVVSNSFGEIKIDKNYKSSGSRIDAVDAIICSHKGIFKQETTIDLSSHLSSYLDKLGW